MNLQFLTGPIVGAVIGYFTNYLAVKMLFHPRKEVKFFGHVLPLTPGVIPKGKPRLAKAVGEVVGNTLLTKEDITKNLMSDDIKEMVSDQIIALLLTEIREGVTNILNADEETYENEKNKLTNFLCGQIIQSLSDINVGTIIAEEGGKAIREKVSGTLFSKMISDDFISSITTPMGDRIQRYIEENGTDYIQPILHQKISELEQSNVLDLLAGMDIDSNMVKKAILSAYQKIVETEAEKVLTHFNIPKIIEDKINEMQTEELEILVLSVMKKELDTIVNLGAIIGFLIGIINIFI